MKHILITLFKLIGTKNTYKFFSWMYNSTLNELDRAEAKARKLEAEVSEIQEIMLELKKQVSSH
jgi:hypothetical protein